MYEIPSNIVTATCMLTLTHDWDKYIVNLDWGTSALGETQEVEAG